MDWRLKVARQAVLVRMPFGYALRRFKRRHFGYEPDAGNLRATLTHLRQMTEALDAMGRTFEGATVLEIGSGWFPTIPTMLALRGAKRVLLSDLTPHMDDVTFSATLRFLKRNMPTDSKLSAVARFSDLPLTYLAPFNVNALVDGSIDYVISRTVLEHIPEHDLMQLMTALRPKIARGGLMVHLIDHSDHLEHVDRSISKINFLTWSKRKHAFVNYLTREGENRLRHHEYRRIFEASGYQVVGTAIEIHAGTCAIAKALPLVAPYSDMSPEQVAALSSLYLLSPGAMAAG